MPQFIIEKLNPPPTSNDTDVHKPGDVAAPDSATNVTDDESLQMEQADGPEYKNDSVGMKVTNYESQKEEKDESATISNNSNNIVSSSRSTSTNNSTTAKVQKITPSDRSKALAQSRILLDETLLSLKELCQSDTCKDQSYRGCIVELSKSQKVWKPDFTLEQMYQLNQKTADGSSGKVAASGGGGGSRKSHGFNYHLKYDSTIEQSEDFKKFMENREQMLEERKNRPKPPPGGIVSGSNVSVLDDSSKAKISTDENGQPIAALVLHLQEKKAKMRKIKVQKKSSRLVSTSESSKKSSRKKKSGTKTADKVSASSGSKGGTKTSVKKDNGGGKKKKKRNKVPSAAPSMILTKPGNK